MKILKRISILLIVILISHIGLAQHFTTVWTGGSYRPMDFIIQDASIDGVDME